MADRVELGVPPPLRGPHNGGPLLAPDLNRRVVAIVGDDGQPKLTVDPSCQNERGMAADIRLAAAHIGLGDFPSKPQRSLF